jgi:hypothetical protein
MISLLELALDDDGCCSANDSPQGINIIISFEEQGLETALASPIFKHGP